MGNTDTSNANNGGDGTNNGPDTATNAGTGGNSGQPSGGGNAGNQQTPQTNDDPAGADQLGDPGKRALDSMKDERNSARRELAEVKKKLQGFEDAQKSAEQKAEDAAKAAETRAREALDKIAAAEARAALTGVVSDPAEFVADLNLGKFINYESGEVDSDGIAKLKDKYAGFSQPQQQKPGGMAPNPAQGANGSKPNQQAGQLTKEQLKGMTPEQIVKVQKDGQLTDLLGTKK